MEREENKNSHKTIKILGSILLGAIIIVSAVAIFAFTDIKTITFATNDKPYSSYLEEELLGSYPDCPDKADREYLPKKMFCQLPDKNKDFEEYMVLYEHGKIKDLESIPLNVWVQPEFSSTWNGQVLKLLQYPEPNRIGGGAKLPRTDNADAGITLSPGDTGRVNFIIRNSPLSIFFLGMQLEENYPAYQSLHYEDINIETTQDPDQARECFDVAITPNEFALAPSFPQIVYTEDYHYAEMIKVKIKVNEDCPSGKYVLGVDPKAPSSEFSDNYFGKEYNGKKILTKYSEVGGYLALDRPFFRTFITVE